MRKPVVAYLATLALVAAMVGCGRSNLSPPAPPVAGPVAPAPVPTALSAAAPTPAEKAVAPEKNPPGDIPDTQVFVEYVSAAGG
jgi:hypothetical protein